MPYQAQLLLPRERARGKRWETVGLDADPAALLTYLLLQFPRGKWRILADPAEHPETPIAEGTNCLAQAERTAIHRLPRQAGSATGDRRAQFALLAACKALVSRDDAESIFARPVLNQARSAILAAEDSLTAPLPADAPIDLLEDLNACACTALEQLDANQAAEARTSIRAIMDAVQEHIDRAEES